MLMLSQDAVAGSHYRTATSEKVLDRGVRCMAAKVGGEVRFAKCRVVDNIANNLMSVYDMCASGHRVVFDIDPGGQDLIYIEHVPSGIRLPMKFRNRVWEVELDVLPYDRDCDSESYTRAASGALCPLAEEYFHRRARRL